MLEKSKRIFRRFISSRWFPLAVACAALLAVLVIAFLLGFRITYAPEIENSWDAISGVADWVGIIVSILSAIASFMAVWYAIRVADKQNQIALFEKRYELYTIVNYCYTFSGLLKKAKNTEDVKECYLKAFYNIKVGENEDENNLILLKFLVIFHQLEQLQFMLRSDEEMLQYIYDIVKALSNVVDECIVDREPVDLDSKIQKLSELVNDPQYEILRDTIRKDLILN